MKRRNFLTRLVLGIAAIPAAIKGFGKSTERLTPYVASLNISTDYNVGIANCVWWDGRKLGTHHTTPCIREEMAKGDKPSHILWIASDPKAYCGKDIDIYKIDEMGKIL